MEHTKSTAISRRCLVAMAGVSAPAEMLGILINVRICRRRL
jgi:hypothetical protein